MWGAAAYVPAVSPDRDKKITEENLVLTERKKKPEGLIVRSFLSLIDLYTRECD